MFKNHLFYYLKNLIEIFYRFPRPTKSLTLKAFLKWFFKIHFKLTWSNSFLNWEIKVLLIFGSHKNFKQFWHLHDVIIVIQFIYGCKGTGKGLEIDGSRRKWLDNKSAIVCRWHNVVMWFIREPSSILNEFYIMRGESLR